MFDFEKMTACKLYTAPMSERVVEFSPEDIDMANVARVLSLAVDAKCLSAVANTGYADVQGRVNFHVIYLDKEGVTRGVDYNADYTATVEGEFIDGESVQCDVTVAESEVSANEVLTLTAVLELRVHAIKVEEFEALVGADDCYITKSEIILPTHIATKSVTLPFNIEKNVGVEIDSVLSLSAVCATRGAKTVDGEVLAKANVIARVTYLEDGNIRVQDFNIPLDEEIAIDGVKEGDSVVLACAIKSSRIVLQGVTDDNTIVLEGEATIKAQVFRCEAKEVVSDLFMLTNNTQIEHTNDAFTCIDGCGYFAQRVSGSVVLLDNKPSAIEVSALPYAKCYCSKAGVKDENTLHVEGVVNTDIIYRDENGYNSARAEIPFVLDIASEMPLSPEVCAHCSVKDITATLNGDREFIVDVNLLVTACGFSPVAVSYISNVEVGQEREQNTSALSIYVASSTETMLDVCKALSAMPEDILAQNPDLTLPFEDDARIVYFRKMK